MTLKQFKSLKTDDNVFDVWGGIKYYGTVCNIETYNDDVIIDIYYLDGFSVEYGIEYMRSYRLLQLATDL
jgi:hypothetical protein